MTLPVSTTELHRFAALVLAVHRDPTGAAVQLWNYARRFGAPKREYTLAEFEALPIEKMRAVLDEMEGAR
jgi:hypothetical protein